VSACCKNRGGVGVDAVLSKGVAPTNTVEQKLAAHNRQQGLITTLEVNLRSADLEIQRLRARVAELELSNSQTLGDVFNIADLDSLVLDSLDPTLFY
jgi:hypothetical protein